MPDFLTEKKPFQFQFLNAKECLNILTDAEKNEMVEHKTDLEFSAGEIIIKHGIDANSVLYVTEGLVKLEIVNGSKTATVGMVLPHSFIGIICCFAFNKFDFTATALEKTKVSFIEMSIFEKYIKNNGDFALNLIKHMSGVANGLFHKLTNLSQKNIEGALSLFLLEFEIIYNSSKYKLPVNRKELAHMLGYSKESVINTLSKFNKENIIRVSDRKIEILNQQKLKQISLLG
jgi:CRP-like cAMP-binding protein